LFHNKTHSFFRKAFLRILLGAGLFLFALNVSAQDTKGANPTVTPGSTGQKKKLFGNNQSGPRVQSQRGKRAKNVFPQKGPYVHKASKTPKGEKAYTQRGPGPGVTSGRIKPPKPSGRSRNIYSQRGPYVNNPSPKGKKEKASTVRTPGYVRQSKAPARKPQKNIYPQRGPYVNNPSRSPKKEKASTVRLPGYVKPGKEPVHKKRNVYPQHGPFVNNPSRVAKMPGTDPKNKPLSKSRRLSASEAAARGRSMGIKGAGFKTITSQFLTRGRKNVYWGKYSKKEKAVTTDIAGRKLRTKNYHSPKIGLVGRDTLHFFRKSPQSVKRKPPQTVGGFRSATHSGKAWSGDISGKRLRKTGTKGNAEKAGKFVWPRKLSVTASGERTGKPLNQKAGSATRAGRASLKPVPTKQPGLGGGAFIMFSKSGKPKKRISGSGGSVSGKLWNNRNQPVSVSSAGAGTINASRFSGRTKSRRPGKGGGSVSGQIWNNRNAPVSVSTAGAGTVRASKFKGRIKGIIGRGSFTTIGLNFTGYTKTRKPEKGGGSVSGKLWNNRNTPLAAQPGGRGTLRAAAFQGNVKTRRPEKGGGSVSGKLWNNRNTPLASLPPGGGTLRAAAFQGKAKTRRPEKGGGSISGQLWNNRNQPIAVETGGQGAARASQYRGKMKYNKPEQTAGKPAKYSGNIKGAVSGKLVTELGLDYSGDYKRNRNARYVQNPLANKESLKKNRQPNGMRLSMVPGMNQNRRAINMDHYAHSVKLKKSNNKQLHPDAKYAHSQRDNVKQERTILMNIKLTWAKLFKKSDNQPRNLKEKPGKPRYDPKEQGLWYE